MKVVFVKGAPERVLGLCEASSKSASSRYWLEKAAMTASKGMRVLGLAFKFVPWNYQFSDEEIEEQLNGKEKGLASNGGFQLTGLVGIMDPPRVEVLQAIQDAQRAGITVKMITGDHPITALAIGKKLGLHKEGMAVAEDEPAIRDGDRKRYESCPVDLHKGDDQPTAALENVDVEIDIESPSSKETSSQKETRGRSLSGRSARANSIGSATKGAVLTGTDLDYLIVNSMDLFDEAVRDNNIFARTTPEHKLRIVQSLQRQGFICSMTGDGVNDAPALKAANIGVAMGITGTSVAKNAASMIITDDNFSTIVDAIRIGRTTYTNLMKIITFVLPTNGGQAFSIIAALILGIEVPITALQILWVNMVTSVTLGIVLAFELPDRDVLYHKPRPANKPLFGKFLSWRLSFVSLVLVLIVLGMFEWDMQRKDDVDYLRTASVNALCFAQIGYIFNCRNLRQCLPPTELFSFKNPTFYYGILAIVVLQMLFTYAPPFQYVFASKPLDGTSWWRIIILLVGVFIVVEVEKGIGYARLQWREKQRNRR